MTFAGLEAIAKLEDPTTVRVMLVSEPRYVGPTAGCRAADVAGAART